MVQGGQVAFGPSHVPSHDDDRRRSGSHSGKQKKAALQQQRLREREKSARREALAESDERLGDLNTEKLIRAHCFVDTGRGTREARVLLRLRLCSKDRPAAAADSSPRRQPTPQLTPAEKAEKAAKASIAKVRERLSATCTQKSAREAAEEWRHACTDCVQLLRRASPSAADANGAGSGWSAALCTELYLALQQAMQSGPLQAHKAARFALLRKWCSNAGGAGATTAAALLEHPHAQAAALLLDAIEASIAQGIALSENQRVNAAKWRKEFGKAFASAASPAAVDVADEEGEE